jgi:DNA repair exonuclease SbcCD ATPase subunit
MRLREFLLEGFAQHERTVVEFRLDEPNLILGPNESGKSHLMSGLTGTLFGMNHREIDRFTPWHGEPVMRGRLRLTVDEDEIEIDRRFLAERVEVRVNGDLVYEGRGRVDLHLPEDQRYREMLFRWIGFNDHEVFERTVFVGQDLLRDDRLGQISARIKQVITGSHEASYDTVIGDLQEALTGVDGLKMGPRDRRPRRLEQLQKELADLRVRSGEAERVQARVGRVREEEMAHQEALETAQREREMLDGLVREAGNLEGLRGAEERERHRWAELDERIDRLDRLEQRRAEQDARVRELRVPGDPNPDDVRRLGSQIDQLQSHIDDLASRLEWARQRAAVPQRRPAPVTTQSDGSRRGMLLGTGAALTAGFLVLGIVIHPVLFAGMLAGLVFLILGLVQQQPSHSEQPVMPPLDSRSTEIADLERDIERERQKLDDLLGERDRMLWEAGLPDLDALYRRLWEHREATIRLESIDAVDPEQRADLERQRNTARQNAGLAQDRIERLLVQHPGLSDVSAEQLHQFRQRLAVAEEAERHAKGELHRLAIERESLARGSDDAEALKIEIADLEAEIARVEHLAGAHDLAISILQHSVRDFQENALDPVGQDASRYFARITGGRYQSVALDKDSMIPSVSTGAIEDVAYEQLSRGAKDQLYLSIRAALIDALSGGRELPLVLDDPAASFDAERLAATAEVLREIATSRQVLLLSHNEAWTHWFEPVARLERVVAATG